MIKIQIDYDNNVPASYSVNGEIFVLFNKYEPILLGKAIENLQYLINLVNENVIIINDYKKFLNFVKKQPFIENVLIKNYLNVYDGGGELYNKLIGSASFIYSYLENNRVFVNDDWRSVHYEFTISGRSRTFDFNVQNSKEDLFFSNQRDEFMVFDWSNADPWCMAQLSGDDVLLEYVLGDLYNTISIKENISRDDAKRLFLSSVYKLDCDADVLRPFVGLRKYIKDCISKFESGQEIYTILGKPITADRGLTSAFNRVVQASTAHLLQSALLKFFKNRYNIITELHDSIIISVFKNEWDRDTLRKAIKIFKTPFDDFPTLKCKIYKGKTWKTWKKVAVV